MGRIDIGYSGYCVDFFGCEWEFKIEDYVVVVLYVYVMFISCIGLGLLYIILRDFILFLMEFSVLCIWVWVWVVCLCVFWLRS